MCYTVSARLVCPTCSGRIGLADSLDVEKKCRPGVKCPYRFWQPLPRRPREERIVSHRHCAACVRQASASASGRAGAGAGAPPATELARALDKTGATSFLGAHTLNATFSDNIVRNGFAAMGREWEVRNGVSPRWRLCVPYPEKENRGFWKRVFAPRRYSL
ncbi:hypothetical protein AYO20_10175 [Fonsecaea nubica]|uniref:Uncharacterized protein n=1 Tax=Fonsecaea nubica TaxID=856822 RepID=A0A178C8K5_9EURO|nr:hypothetical protein AYO20_10175 [Fonsecaea nubica]OAL26298.1 hypothetical protein AYO20_10175 [Fonsecaea nubica]